MVLADSIPKNSIPQYMKNLYASQSHTSKNFLTMFISFRQRSIIVEVDLAILACTYNLHDKLNLQVVMLCL